MGRISQRCMVPWLNALVLANSLCQDSEDAALITVYNKSMNLRQTSLATSWQSPRDLAIVPPPTEVHGGAEVFTIYSAVPSFGEDGNFIALLLREPIKGRSIFCSGSGRAHLSQVRIFEHSMLCDWPEEEKKHELFEVFLEDAHGKHLAKVIANRKFGLLKKYQTVACVRDIFAPNRPNSLQAGQKAFGPALKMLVQWMEYNWLHGIDHFFIYTFNGTERAIKNVMEPYLKSGVATRIHFDDYPWINLRQKQMANDCKPCQVDPFSRWWVVGPYHKITWEHAGMLSSSTTERSRKRCRPLFSGSSLVTRFGDRFSGCPSMRSPSMRIFIGDRDDLIVAETKSCQLMKQFDAVWCGARYQKDSLAVTSQRFLYCWRLAKIVFLQRRWRWKLILL